MLEVLSAIQNSVKTFRKTLSQMYFCIIKNINVLVNDVT